MDSAALATPASFTIETPVLELRSEENEVMSEYRDGAYGLTCKDFKDAREVAAVVNLAVRPAMVAMMSPAIRAAVLTELAGIGLVAGTPAVVSVTVIGYFGVQAVKILLRKPLEDCARLEREALKRELLQELEARYPVRGTPLTTIQVAH